MRRWVATLAGAAVAASLPRWLPQVVVNARVRVFTAVNGQEGIAVPGGSVGTGRVLQRCLL
ncbi:hypothetical protein [Streptomyces spectabilis]|uniref:Uncharacterized protein n=1 Tax=Streptomyces spectabilis TaxID=68270 RepID=A0A7W8AYE0_STRST|nr:hypothetical protein [Streptomyces spectabilis]MBB5105428.1 hypothetical protein [Streptomyces spectabilis]MCI3906617.1 hypothetical protein [Streptomyces spectabilis]